MLSEHDSLKKQIEQLKQTNKILNQKYKKANKKAIQYDRAQTRINACVSRILFCISFLQYLGQTGCVYGSLIRKWMECTLQFNAFSSNHTLGDVTNSDINILFNCSHAVNKVNTTSQFYKLLHHINISRICSEQPHSGIQPPSFANYKLIGIQYINFISTEKEPIPRAKCYFKKGNEILAVDMLAWRTPDIVDFTVNNYILTIHGLQSVFDQSFFQYIEHIHFNQTDYIHALDMLQQNAFPAHTNLSRKDKLLYLTKCYDLISHCYLKLYPSQYKLIHFRCVYIEEKEECSITGCKPPYPVVYLECEHSISLMAYKGILFQSSDADTQSIRCPLCRKDLKIKFSQDMQEKKLSYVPLREEFIHNQYHLFLSGQHQRYPFINKDAAENL